MLVVLILAILFVLFASGAYQLLLALWILRVGEDQNTFFNHGIAGSVLIIIAILALCAMSIMGTFVHYAS